MLTVAGEREPITPSEPELEGLGDLHRQLQDGGSLGWSLVGPSGSRIDLSQTTIQVLRQAVDALVRDQVVVVRRFARELTADQAADLLALPAPEVDRLFDEGVLPARSVRNRRRVRFEDVIAFKLRHDAERSEILRRLSEQGQEIEALLE